MWEYKFREIIQKVSAMHWGTSRLHTLSHIIVIWIKRYKRNDSVLSTFSFLY